MFETQIFLLLILSLADANWYVCRFNRDCVCPALKISYDCIVCLSYDSSKMLRKHIFVLLLEHFHSLKMSFFQVL